jgi:signal transduction histidine kinase
MRASYRRLAARYQALLETIRNKTEARFGLVRLVSRALKATDVGWALIRGGSMAFSNTAFQRLCHARPDDGAWHVTVPEGAPLSAPPGDGGPHSSLSELVGGLARNLEEAPAERQLRFRALSRQRVMDVVLERSGDSRSGDGVLAMVRDVTASARMEADLTEAQPRLLQHERVRALGEVALGVAHDVNNIIGALQLRVEVLAHDPACVASQSQNIAALQRIAEDAGRLVSRLQSLARPRGEDDQMLDLRQVVMEAAEIAGSGLALRARQAGIELRIEAELGPLPKVRGNADDIRNIVVNLLINAKDAMPAGGVIRVSGESTAREVVIRVEDQGTGLPADIGERLFEPFYTTKGPRGTGLGLAMARRAMERLGGSISAWNRAEGGATFELRFSRDRRRGPSAERPPVADRQL